MDKRVIQEIEVMDRDSRRIEAKRVSTQNNSPNLSEVRNSSINVKVLAEKANSIHTEYKDQSVSAKFESSLNVGGDRDQSKMREVLPEPATRLEDGVDSLE